jgi:hypothetical protein
VHAGAETSRSSRAEVLVRRPPTRVSTDEQTFLGNVGSLLSVAFPLKNCHLEIICEKIDRFVFFFFPLKISRTVRIDFLATEKKTNIVIRHLGIKHNFRTSDREREK